MASDQSEHGLGPRLPHFGRRLKLCRAEHDCSPKELAKCLKERCTEYIPEYVGEDQLAEIISEIESGALCPGWFPKKAGDLIRCCDEHCLRACGPVLLIELSDDMISDETDGTFDDPPLR